MRDWIGMLTISSTQHKHSNTLGSFQFITLIGLREERPAGSECRWMAYERVFSRHL